MNYIVNFFQQYLIKLSSFPVVIQIAVFFILASTLATFTFMCSVFLIRRSKARYERIVTELRPKMFSFLRNIITSKDEYTDAEVRALFIENFGDLDKKAYVSLIPTLEDVVKQEHEYVDSANYHNTINGLKVLEHLEKRLDVAGTRERLRALQSLSCLDLTVSDSKILPHTYAKNVSLKKESRASYVAVSNNDPFKFFDQENDLNRWNEISLLQQFTVHHKDNLPNFSKWIKYSKDNAQVIFFIKLVAHFNQVSSVNTVKEFLSHDDHAVRREAIVTLGKMQVREIESQLVKMYSTQPYICQTAIIEAVSFIGSGRLVGFLKNAWEMANNHELKKLIAEVIFLYGKPGKALFEELTNREIGFNLLILQHVQNPLIPSLLKNYHINAKPMVFADAIREVRGIEATEVAN